jgi:hypothetical protein
MRLCLTADAESDVWHRLLKRTPSGTGQGQGLCLAPPEVPPAVHNFFSCLPAPAVATIDLTHNTTVRSAPTVHYGYREEDVKEV